jgi:hypothetical protein
MRRATTGRELIRVLNDDGCARWRGWAFRDVPALSGACLPSVESCGCLTSPALGCGLVRMKMKSTLGRHGLPRGVYSAAPTDGRRPSRARPAAECGPAGARRARPPRIRRSRHAQSTRTGDGDRGPLGRGAMVSRHRSRGPHARPPCHPAYLRPAQPAWALPPRPALSLSSGGARGGSRNPRRKNPHRDARKGEENGYSGWTPTGKELVV